MKDFEPKIRGLSIGLAFSCVYFEETRTIISIILASLLFYLLSICFYYIFNIKKH